MVRFLRANGCEVLIWNYLRGTSPSDEMIQMLEVGRERGISVTYHIVTSSIIALKVLTEHY